MAATNEGSRFTTEKVDIEEFVGKSICNLRRILNESPNNLDGVRISYAALFYYVFFLSLRWF